MPIAETGRSPARQAVVVGLGAALGVLAILFLVTQADRLFGQADLDIDVGDGIYRPGNVDDLAEGVADNGPLLLSDPSGGDRDLWINHSGSQSDEGWHAIAVRQPAASRDCFVEWEPDQEVFADNCTDATYPPTGDGLPKYPLTIDGDGNLAVDLSAGATVDEG